MFNELLTISRTEDAAHMIRFWVDDTPYYSNRRMYAEELRMVSKAIVEGWCNFEG